MGRKGGARWEHVRRGRVGGGCGLGSSDRCQVAPLSPRNRQLHHHRNPLVVTSCLGTCPEPGLGGMFSFAPRSSQWAVQQGGERGDGRSVLLHEQERTPVLPWPHTLGDAQPRPSPAACRDPGPSEAGGLPGSEAGGVWTTCESL